MRNVNDWVPCLGLCWPDSECTFLIFSDPFSLQWRHNELDGVSKAPASRLFTRPFIQAQIKENIKAPRHWPLCGEFTGHRWIPPQRVSSAENISIWWRHHVPFRLDYCCVIAALLTSYVPWLHAVFYCRRTVARTYMAIVLVLGALGVTVVVKDKFSLPKYRSLRAGK